MMYFWGLLCFLFFIAGYLLIEGPLFAPLMVAGVACAVVALFNLRLH